MKANVKDRVVSTYSYLNKKMDIVRTPEGERCVITSAPVAKGETVAVWGGKVVSGDQLSGMSGIGTAHRVGHNVFMVTPLHDDGLDTIHLIRHSGTPNCGFSGDITLVAMRDIESGEEITYDTMMNSSDVLEYGIVSRTIREKYNGYFSSYIQREIEETPGLQVQPKFKEGAWGLLTSIDLEKCNGETIRNASEIRRFVYELCDLIDMKRFGECHVVHFGEDERVAGYSMFQLIETSCISGHFANESNTSYIDIFSCKAYDPKVVADFTKEFFKGDALRMNVTNRF